MDATTNGLTVSPKILTYIRNRLLRLPVVFFFKKNWADYDSFPLDLNK